MKQNKRLPDPEKVLRCACGDILRRKNWRDHWNICCKGSAREATAEEIKMLEAHETRMQEHFDRCAREQKEWEAKRVKA